MTDFQWFQDAYGPVVQTVRVVASEQSRQQRGWVFTPGKPLTTFVPKSRPPHLSTRPLAPVLRSSALPGGLWAAREGSLRPRPQGLPRLESGVGGRCPRGRGLPSPWPATLAWAVLSGPAGFRRPGGDLPPARCGLTADQGRPAGLASWRRAVDAVAGGPSGASPRPALWQVRGPAQAPPALVTEAWGSSDPAGTIPAEGCSFSGRVHRPGWAESFVCLSPYRHTGLPGDAGRPCH